MCAIQALQSDPPSFSCLSALPREPGGGTSISRVCIAPASMNHFYLLPLIESLIKVLVKLTDINIRLVHFRSNKSFLLHLPPTPPKLRHCGWCILQELHCELYSLKLQRIQMWNCRIALPACSLFVAWLCSMTRCVSWTITPSHHPWQSGFRLRSLLTTDAKMLFSFSELLYFPMLLLHCANLSAFLLPTFFCQLFFSKTSLPTFISSLALQLPPCSALVFSLLHYIHLCFSLGSFNPV